MSATLIPKRVGLLAVDCQVEIWLAEVAQELDVMHARECSDMTAVTSSPFCSRTFKSSPKILSAGRTFGASHGFSHIVFDGL